MTYTVERDTKNGRKVAWIVCENGRPTGFYDKREQAEASAARLNAWAQK